MIMRITSAIILLTMISVNCLAQARTNESICDVSKKYAEIAYGEKLNGVELIDAVNATRFGIEGSGALKTLSPQETPIFIMFLFNTFDSVYSSKVTDKAGVIDEAHGNCKKNIANAKMVLLKRISLCDYLSEKFLQAKELKLDGYSKAFAMELIGNTDINLNKISEYAVEKTYNEEKVENIEANELKICMRKINEK
jgi:hypothetical protein